MTKPLLPRSEPEWLSNVSDFDELPIMDLLQDSLFYPACGRDGDPVRYLGGFVHSFVYADYSVPIEEITSSLFSPEFGLKGYRILFCKDVSNSIIPRGWHPSKEVIKGMRLARVQACAPLQYGLWAVLERLDGFGLEHGPNRMSFLFIGGEGVSAYQALYKERGLAPIVLAIIQCGIAFGNAYTDFANPEEGLAAAVLEDIHQRPQFLLHGGWYGSYEHSCWPDYSYKVARWRAAQGELGLWWRPH
jgi:hypothetical protein